MFQSDHIVWSFTIAFLAIADEAGEMQCAVEATHIKSPCADRTGDGITPDGAYNKSKSQKPHEIFENVHGKRHKVPLQISDAMII
jgi:hypothetical protein